MSTSNHDLFNILFRHHSKELLAFAGWRVGDLTAEDLVQESYLRLLQHPEPASIINPRAYLYKVVANLGFDQHCKDSVRSKYVEPDEIEADELVSPLPGPEALMEGELLLRDCLTTLRTLPEV
jgi:DNA-directed RNA polymerase specialized sigma24 family protein